MPNSPTTEEPCPWCGDQTWTFQGYRLCAASRCGWDTAPSRDESPWEEEKNDA